MKLFAPKGASTDQRRRYENYVGYRSQMRKMRQIVLLSTAEGVNFGYYEEMEVIHILWVLAERRGVAPYKLSIELDAYLARRSEGSITGRFTNPTGKPGFVEIGRDVWVEEAYVS